MAAYANANATAERSVRKRLRLLFTWIWMWLGSVDSESNALPSCPVISIAHSTKRSRCLRFYFFVFTFWIPSTRRVVRWACWAMKADRQICDPFEVHIWLIENAMSACPLICPFVLSVSRISSASKGEEMRVMGIQ